MLKSREMIVRGNSFTAKDDLFIRKDLLGSKYNVDVDQMKAFYDEHMKNSSDVKDEL